jgi:hypothetical protein
MIIENKAIKRAEELREQLGGASSIGERTVP